MRLRTGLEGLKPIPEPLQDLQRGSSCQVTRGHHSCKSPSRGVFLDKLMPGDNKPESFSM